MTAKRSSAGSGVPLSRSEAGRKGGLARARAFTSAYQRKIRKKLSSEQAAANGRKGAAVTIQRHGLAKLMECSRQWRLAHPSPDERLMIGILSTLKIKFEREFKLDGSLHTVDFYLPDHAAFIEVEGEIHQPGKPGFEKRCKAKARKLALIAKLGLPVLTVKHGEFKNLPAVIERVIRFAQSRA